MSSTAHSAHHTDFAAPAADPWAGTQARAAGAPVALVSVPGLPDVMRPAGPTPDLDRALHPAFPVSDADVISAATPFLNAPVEVDRAFHPYPIALTPTAPHRPVAPEGRGALDAELTSAQFAAVARSRAKLDRARSYADRLGTHAADIRAKLAAASERQVAAAIGTAEPDPAVMGPLRGEAVEVDRQHRQALAALADIEAEHARNESDLRALTGSDGEARAKLAKAHAARSAAQTAADDAKALLHRATAHRSDVDGKLTSARAEEARHDADATARLRAALADGDAPPVASAPLARISGILEDDLRAASAAVDALAAEHAVKVAALTVAHRAVLSAVDGVLVVDAEQVARELQAADARAQALRVRLHSYTNRRAGDWARPTPKPAMAMPGGWFAPDPSAGAIPPAIRTTAVIGQAIDSGPVPQTGGLFSDKWAAETRAWDAYAAFLTADPQAEATFADSPAVPPVASLPVRVA